MIFITLGSQKFQFNRLLEEIDNLIDEKKINEEVFAQTGYSDYVPKNYKFKKFLDRNEFNNCMGSCDKVITHGGTGAIVGALKKSKKVIAIPRLKKFGEHVDDHQLQLVTQFKKMGFIDGLIEIKDLHKEIIKIENLKFKEYISNTEKIIESIDLFLEQ